MTTTDRPTTTGSKSTSATPDGIAQTAAQTARSVADSVAGAAGEVGARIPDVAQGTREALTEANRMVHRGSDQTLKLVGAGSIGLATGLLIGGAPRLLVVMAAIPAALIGATLVERMDTADGSSVSSPTAVRTSQV
jgi:phosphoglycerate dehydrogenase-like enzyme